MNDAENIVHQLLIQYSCRDQVYSGDFKSEESIIDGISQSLIKYSQQQLNVKGRDTSEIENIFLIQNMISACCYELRMIIELVSEETLKDEELKCTIKRLLKSDFIDEVIVGGALFGAFSISSNRIHQDIIEDLKSVIFDGDPVRSCRIVTSCFAALCYPYDNDQDEDENEEGISVHITNSEGLSHKFKEAINSMLSKHSSEIDPHFTLRNFLMGIAVNLPYGTPTEESFKSAVRIFKSSDNEDSLILEGILEDEVKPIIADLLIEHGVLRPLCSRLQEARTDAERNKLVELIKKLFHNSFSKQSNALSLIVENEATAYDQISKTLFGSIISESVTLAFDQKKDLLIRTFFGQILNDLSYFLVELIICDNSDLESKPEKINKSLEYLSGIPSNIVDSFQEEITSVLNSLELIKTELERFTSTDSIRDLLQTIENLTSELNRTPGQ